MNLNKVFLLGSLTRDPESRETHSGSTVVRIVVAVSRDYFSRERNQRVRETDSIEVQAWGPTGQQLAQQVKKGANVMVEGRLKVDSWETPTGEKRQRLVVHMDNFAPVGAGSTPAPAVADAPAAGEEGVTEEGGPTPTAGGPGASGKRKRRRRRGPRRDGLPAGPVVPMSDEERAAFAAGITTEGGSAPTTSPAPSPEAPAPGTAPTRAEPAPPPPAASAPPPPPPPPVERKPVPNVSLKEDMPF